MDTELLWLLYKCSADLGDRTSLLVTADWCQERDPQYKSLEALLRFMPIAIWPKLFTGSRRYGTPSEGSDFDWVVKFPTGIVGEILISELRKDADSGGKDYKELFGTTRLDCAMRFGPVNLLIVSTVAQWDAWVAGTAVCVSRAPITREQAISVFQDCQRLARLLR